MRRAAPALAFALALSVAAGPARALPMGPGAEPAAVFSLASDLESDLPAKTLTNALRQLVLDGPDYALNSLGPPLVATAVELKCKMGGPGGILPDERAFDGACLKKLGRHLGVRRFFWGYVTARGGATVVRLHVWREGEPDRVATLPYDEANRERVAARLYAKLVRPEQVGDLTVVGEAAGELVVGGRPEGPYAPGVELTLPAGEYSVEVRQGPRVVARARAVVLAGGRAEARLEAVAAPPPPPGALAGSARPGRPPEARHGEWKRTAGFVGLGLGVALLGAGAVSSARVQGLGDTLDSERPFVAYRSGVAGEEDSCGAADARATSTRAGAATAERVRRVCSAVDTLQVAQLIFYGASALAIGAGAYLLATAPKAPPKPAAWSLQPWAGASGGGVRLGLTF